jgi:hypothetical protein
MPTKLVVTRTEDAERHILQVLVVAESPEELRAGVRDLPPGEYSILTVARGKVTVRGVPARTMVDWGAAAAPRARTAGRKRGRKAKAKPAPDDTADEVAM